MGTVAKKESVQVGSNMKYRCPACGKNKEAFEIFWDKVPFPGSPGKVRCCVSCSGVIPLLMGWHIPQSASWANADG